MGRDQRPFPTDVPEAAAQASPTSTDATVANTATRTGAVGEDVKSANRLWLGTVLANAPGHTLQPEAALEEPGAQVHRIVSTARAAE
jgi:hypothetical protein